MYRIKSVASLVLRDWVFCIGDFGLDLDLELDVDFGKLFACMIEYDGIRGEKYINFMEYLISLLKDGCMDWRICLHIGGSVCIYTYPTRGKVCGVHVVGVGAVVDVIFLRKTSVPSSNG